jgi:hypothetical protein
VVILAGVAAVAGWRLFSSPERAVRNKALARREIATRVLGEEVAAQLASGQAIILSNPFTQKPGQAAEVYAFEQAGIAGLKKGWSDKVRLAAVVFPELSTAALQNPETVPIDPDSKTPLSFLTAQRAWDGVLEQHQGVDVFVSLIGLPLDLQGLEVWRRPKPKIALLLPDLRMAGGLASVRDAFQRGKLLALVLNKPGAPAEAAALDRDYRVEFERRFVLVTARNFNDMVRAYPRAF